MATKRTKKSSQAPPAGQAEATHEPVPQVEPSESLAADATPVNAAVAAAPPNASPTKTRAIRRGKTASAAVAAAVPAVAPHESEAGRGLRQLYSDRCQICGSGLRLQPNETYAELYLFEQPKKIEDLDRACALVVCPNHRALLAAGSMALDPDHRTIYSADDQSPYLGKTLFLDRHPLLVSAVHAAWQRRIVVSAEVLANRFRDPREVVEEAFRAALIEDEQSAFTAYIRLVVGNETMGATSVRGIRDFSWRNLRRHVADYLTERDERSFVVNASVPPEVGPQTSRVRLLIRSVTRNDAPIVLVRNSEGRWQIDFNGL